MAILLSIITPTLNSAVTLPRCLAAVQAQTLPANEREILIVDGGSTDGTQDIARKFGARVIDNPRVVPEYAKFLGLRQASGRYVMFLDSDEVLENRESLAIRLRIFREQPEVKNIITSGLKTPTDFSFVSRYINMFGDPLSYFVYGISGEDYRGSFRQAYTIVRDTPAYTVFRFQPQDILPIIDAGSHTFDRQFLQEQYPKQWQQPEVIPVLFTLMALRSRRVAVTKQDFVQHYSSASVTGYIRKLQWRVINNLFYGAGSGSGYSARQQLQPDLMWKKYLFLPYAVSLVLPLLASLWYVIRFRNIRFLWHLVFTVATLVLIVWYQLIKVIGQKPALSSYGK